MSRALAAEQQSSRGEESVRAAAISMASGSPSATAERNDFADVVGSEGEGRFNLSGVLNEELYRPAALA
jgi:hypothetical protein